MKQLSIFNAEKSTSSLILCCALERSINIQIPQKLGRKRIEWITTSQSCRDSDGISGEPAEFEWNIFPGFDTLQLYGKVKDPLSRSGETPENFTGRNLFMSMFNDISCGTKDNEKECLANCKVVSIFAKKFGIGQWSLIGPGSEKKWSSMEEKSAQGIWDHIADKDAVGIRRKWMSNFPCNNSIVQGYSQEQRT